MNSLLLSSLAVAATVCLTSVAQLILKWQIAKIGTPQETSQDIARWLVRVLLNPWIIAVFAGAFLAAISWFFAVSRVPLSYAYPFVALTFPIVVIGSGLIFGDPIHWTALLGTAFIVAGLVIIAFGLQQT